MIRDPCGGPWQRSERKKANPERSRSRGVGSHALDDCLGELVAEEAAAVERLPDRHPNRGDLVRAERRVHDAGRIGPGRQPLVGRSEDRAARGEPERQLAGGVEVQRSTERPGLDQLTLLPERRADVGLCDAVDAYSELELGGRLDLGVHAADGAGDLDEPVTARAFTQ